MSTEDIAGYHGFVYAITHVESGRTYIGKKSLVSRRSRPPLKGKSRRRRDTVESDWRDYWGSSEELLADVERLGEKAFTREILRLCSSRGELNYAELREQVTRDVLLRPDLYYNSFIGTKVHRSHLLKKSSVEKIASK